LDSPFFSLAVRLSHDLVQQKNQVVVVVVFKLLEAL
jgi:hypothetical protein